jgi:hypothetical protein
MRTTSVPLPCGLNYCYDNDNKRICTGAQMGRPNELPDACDSKYPFKIVLRRLKLIDGCYDKEGAYFGGPDNLWYASGRYYKHPIRIFFRAEYSSTAYRLVRDHLPNADITVLKTPL